MLGKIEHLGIAVKDLEKAALVYEQLLGVAPYKKESVDSEKVDTLFFMAGENKIELLQGTDPSSVIHRYVEKKGEGLHHVAFHVDDILAEMERLRKLGFTLLNEQPKKGADNKLICFVHPAGTGGVLVELCQDIRE
jgi:methylmalonyl-CoA/ethylmalonyl-CoA epimerase